MYDKQVPKETRSPIFYCEYCKRPIFTNHFEHYHYECKRSTIYIGHLFPRDKGELNAKTKKDGKDKKSN